MPRPRSLSHDDLAAAALAVIDRDGLAALSMRAVAVELGMGTMSLYRYVSDREQLEGLVVERVLAGVDVSPPPGSWTDQVTALVERVRAAVRVHPEVVPLTMTHRHTSAALLRWTEAILGVLAGAGFTGRRRVLALRALLGHLVGSLQLEHLGPLSGAGTGIMAGLPREEFPLLAETAREAREVPPGEEFGQGLAVLLAGLRTFLAMDEG
ncbi:TetR family transcriptional regulator [Sphaerisporangium melleum]|uniref:TetR family transcriptional regulator n=1 Tax=Sphaerisporangium melleum TaxID=321316 RepID=A0A917RA08_9ACTN|nr:TetR/AcrR family transcriptional regulator C-terminal domain-containing protein [Sphaerisporangium melleum]GGK96685.1 TetR family transcriptional regulator [Sphaerisporangium melleum]GII71024.1 TetR family transcriptional regulator [Sphaerisporangium melleum]